MTEAEIRASERKAIKTLIQLDLLVEKADTPETLTARILQLIDRRDEDYA